MDEAGRTETSGRTRRTRRTRSSWRETALLVGLALVIAVVVKAFLVQAFYIPSASMEPGLVKDDRILVQKVSYWTGSPERGDVVVFRDPGGWLPPAPEPHLLARGLTALGLYPEGGHLVKRVIGVEGDTIVCCDKQGRLSVNGEPLVEGGYIAPQPLCNGPMIRSCDWTAGPVPEGHLFVMGDNRSESSDSSAHLCGGVEARGCDPDAYVDTDLVVGKVSVLAWPLDRFRVLHRPSSFDGVPDPS